MKRLILLLALVMLVTILAKLSASTTPDTNTLLANSNIPDNEITINLTQASNSSAGATITITMYAVGDETPSNNDNSVI